MIDPPLPPHRLVEHWLERHQSPSSFILHMIGIPPTILGFLFIPIYLCLLSVPIFLLALALFIGGYILQFAGHLISKALIPVRSSISSASWASPTSNSRHRATSKHDRIPRSPRPPHNIASLHCQLPRLRLSSRDRLSSGGRAICEYCESWQRRALSHDARLPLAEAIP